MSSSPALKTEEAPILACTISRDVQNFDLLIEDMEEELGEAWGDLAFGDAHAFFQQPEAAHLEFVAVAIDEEDEDDLPQLVEMIKAATARQIKVLLIAQDVSPISLHQLLKLGAEEFVPYPLPDGALHDAIERMRRPAPVAVVAEPDTSNKLKATGDRNGVILPVHGMGGGTGATMLAVNLAWELVNADKEINPRVVILDLDLQFGSVSTFLDLPRRDNIFELWSDTEGMDSDVFMQALQTYNDKLHVLTAPKELIPLDLIGNADVERILEAARTNFDYVIVDMPKTFVQWSETVLSAAGVYFATIELDMRCAQNTLRTIRALKSEELPLNKLRYVLNRAPGLTDLQGRARAKRLAESLDIQIEVQLPDGGKAATQAADHGLPLGDSCPKNPLRKEIGKLAASIHKHNESTAQKRG